MAMLFALVILAQSVQAQDCAALEQACIEATLLEETARNTYDDYAQQWQDCKDDDECTKEDLEDIEDELAKWNDNIFFTSVAQQVACGLVCSPPPAPPTQTPTPTPTPTPEPTPEPTPCPDDTTCGDPTTSFKGVKTRYWLSMEHFTPMLTQGPFVVSQLAGPANPPPGLEAHKGAWVVATEVDMAGLGKIRIETVDPTTLLAPHPNATVPPTTVDALTTMRLSVGGKQLAAGEHTLSMANATIAVSAKRDPSTRRIGIGWVEQITITANGLELSITSAKANKFADEEQQVLGLHLDVAFLTFDESAVRGALPEMWGLQPMSEDTKLLLGEKNVEN